LESRIGGSGNFFRRKEEVGYAYCVGRPLFCHGTRDGGTVGLCPRAPAQGTSSLENPVFGKRTVSIAKKDEAGRTYRLGRPRCDIAGPMFCLAAAIVSRHCRPVAAIVCGTARLARSECAASLLQTCVLKFFPKLRILKGIIPLSGAWGRASP